MRHYLRHYAGEDQYLEALRLVLENGIEERDRTGTGVLAYPGLSMHFDVSKESFPAVTTKKLAFYPMVVELLWFLRGDTNVKWLKDRKCNIWNEWADSNGDLGPVYGAQWREWFDHEGRSHDQIKKVIKEIKLDPQSRRHIVSGWNVAEIEDMALPPCHAFFQFTVIGNKLNLHLTQRSGDMFLGVPFNIASYSLLLLMIAEECNLEPGELIHTINHAHIYKNHVEQVKEQLTRAPFKSPGIHIDESIFTKGLLNWIESWELRKISLDKIKELIHLKDYQCHSAIKAPVAV